MNVQDADAGMFDCELVATKADGEQIALAVKQIGPKEPLRQIISPQGSGAGVTHSASLQPTVVGRPAAHESSPVSVPAVTSAMEVAVPVRWIHQGCVLSGSAAEGGSAQTQHFGVVFSSY